MMPPAHFHDFYDAGKILSLFYILAMILWHGMFFCLCYGAHPTFTMLTYDYIW